MRFREDEHDKSSLARRVSSQTYEYRRFLGHPYRFGLFGKPTRQRMGSMGHRANNPKGLWCGNALIMNKYDGMSVSTGPGLAYFHHYFHLTRTATVPIRPSSPSSTPSPGASTGARPGIEAEGVRGWGCQTAADSKTKGSFIYRPVYIRTIF